MILRCRRGDLALFIGPGPNAGKTVTCLKLVPAGTEDVNPIVGQLWRVDRPLEYCSDELPGVVALKALAPDSKLLPIGKPDPASLGSEVELQQQTAEGC